MKSSTYIILDLFICATSLNFCMEHLNTPYGWMFILPILMYGVGVYLIYEMMEGRGDYVVFLKRQLPVRHYTLACIGVEGVIKSVLIPKNQGVSLVIGVIGLALFALQAYEAKKIETD